MPRMDGLGLLAVIRTEHALRDLPVILLSARAGEEAREALRQANERLEQRVAEEMARRAKA